MKIAGKLFFSSFLLLILINACATMPPEQQRPPAALFSQGVLRASHENTMFRTFEAARATLQEQEMAISEARRDADQGSIQAVRKDGTEVNVTFKSITPAQTEVSIKVGDYGSEEISREINRGIESRLAAAE